MINSSTLFKFPKLNVLHGQSRNGREDIVNWSKLFDLEYHISSMERIVGCSARSQMGGRRADGRKWKEKKMRRPQQEEGRRIVKG
jgi:hypothetical protein